MKQQFNNENTEGRSSLFALDENVAGAIVGAVTLAASFVPYVSYFAWVIPVGAMLVERKSIFVRLCDIQTAICSAIISLFSWLTLILTPFAEAAMKTQYSSRLVSIGIVGIIMSIARVAALVGLILTAYNAYKMKLFNIPGLTPLIKKLSKYS